MARNRFVRWISIQWDRDAARRMEDEAAASLSRSGKEGAAEFEDAMKVGGQKGARALTTSLQRDFKLRMARASQQLADGVINERDFRREGEKAAREFNAGLSSGIKRLQSSTGGLSDAQFIGLAGRNKAIGAGGALAAMRASPLFAPLATLFTVNEGMRQVRNAIEASDELANSVRKLGGTAKITGLNLADLERNAAAAREQFRLSVPIANDLTTEVTKLAAKAGDVSKTGTALAAFLDIGASRGLTASQTLQAVYQSILGIDEGTDKLFNKNPSTIYKEWADQVGRTAASMSDQEKAQALLDATMKAGEVTRGSYLDWLKTTQGEAAQAAMEIRQLQAEIGTTFGPTRVLLLKIQLAVVGILADILKRSPYDEGQLDWNAAVAREAGGTWAAPERPGGFGRSAATDIEAAAARMAAARAPREVPAAVRDLLRKQAEEAKEAADRLQKLAELEKFKADQRFKEQHDASTVSLRDQTLAIVDRVRGVDPFAASGFVLSPEEQFQQFEDSMRRIDGIATDVAGGVADAWQDAFSLMIEEGATVGNFFEGLGRGIASSLGGALAEFAAGEAKKHFASAIGAAAFALGFSSHGNFASAAAAWSSAAQHTAAGLAFSAISGGAAAGAGAVRSRAPGSTFDSGLSIGREGATSRERLGPEIHIYVDGIDPRNPDHQRLTYQTMADAKQRYGEDAKIVYHPRNAA